MTKYIVKNTELRKTAADSFEKDFFKLMNNSVFGRTIEKKLEKRQSIILVDSCDKASRLTTKLKFDRATIFDRNLIAVHMKKTEVYFSKPIYVGQSLLDLSKTLMFDFHYDYIRKKYNDAAELLFTDTDSLYLIHTDDFYKDISRDVKTKFDTSDYPESHPSGILTGINKKVIGMFKDEVAGRQITHFVGLRPKLYSFKVEDDKTVKKCKGIKKNVVKREITFDDYVKCLFSGEEQMKTMKIIRSENHDIYSKKVNKIAVSNDEGKRKVMDYCIHTLALR